MKKIAVLLVVSFLFFSAYQGFAVELWNGFTSDMTREDVIARAKEVLDFRRIVKEEENRCVENILL
jgi:hypothetical protein